ncbi:MAG: hypothetical protein RLZZ519_2835 [Bacteroidota bacterium]|jgi:hypothetical protein
MKIAEKFSKNLFWDVDEASINIEEHARFIVERVVTRGRTLDFFTLLSLMGRERVIREMVKIRYLDAVTLNFLSKIFRVPKSKFRCYIQPRSTQELWQF